MNISLTAITLTTALTLFFTGSALVIDTFWGHEKGMTQVKRQIEVPRFSQATPSPSFLLGAPAYAKPTQQKIKVQRIKKRSKKQTPLKHRGLKSSSFKKININTANAKALTALPGVGPALAKRIIAYRKQQPFKAKQDIKKVKGIGPAKFAKIEDTIQVSR